MIESILIGCGCIDFTNGLIGGGLLPMGGVGFNDSNAMRHTENFSHAISLQNIDDKIRRNQKDNIQHEISLSIARAKFGLDAGVGAVIIGRFYGAYEHEKNVSSIIASMEFIQPRVIVVHPEANADAVAAMINNGNAGSFLYDLVIAPYKLWDNAIVDCGIACLVRKDVNKNMMAKFGVPIIGNRVVDMIHISESVNDDTGMIEIVGMHTAITKNGQSARFKAHNRDTCRLSYVQNESAALIGVNVGATAKMFLH